MTKSKKIKAIIISSAAVLLALIVILTAFFLSNRSPVVMEYGSQKITENSYRYWYSVYKYRILSTYKDISDTDEFWSSKNADGITYEEQFSKEIDGYIKQKIIASVLFDRGGFELTEKARAEIDERYNRTIDAFGGEKKFNEHAKKLGFDADGYLNALIFDYKTAYLYRIMYSGGVFTNAELAEFYNEKYARVKIVIIRKNDDYRREETNSYKPSLDSNGNYIMDKYSEQKKAEAAELIADMKAAIDSGSMTETEYENYYKEENRDFYAFANGYEDGYYLSEYAVYEPKDVIKSALSLKVGEYDYLDYDDYTIFLRRYESAPSAYSSPEYANSEWFTDFSDHCAEYLYYKKLDSYLSEVKISSDVKDGIKLSEIIPNPDF